MDEGIAADFHPHTWRKKKVPKLWSFFSVPLSRAKRQCLRAFVRAFRKAACSSPSVFFPHRALPPSLPLPPCAREVCGEEQSIPHTRRASADKTAAPLPSAHRSLCLSAGVYDLLFDESGNAVTCGILQKGSDNQDGRERRRQVQSEGWRQGYSEEKIRQRMH